MTALPFMRHGADKTTRGRWHPLAPVRAAAPFFGMRTLARQAAGAVVTLVALASLAGCNSATATSTLPPAQVLVTVTPLGGSSSSTVGFPPTLPRGVSTIVVTARDAQGAPVVITTARYRFDLTTAAANYSASAINGLAWSVTTTGAGTVSLTYRLFDLQTSSVVVGPVTLTVTLL